MNTRIFHCFIVAFSLLLALPEYLHAELELMEPGIVLDDEQMLMWMQDASYSVTSGHDEDGLMNWFDAKAWVESLSFGGYEDWRLQEMTDVREWNNSSCEVSYLYSVYGISGGSNSGPFINIPQKDGYYGSSSFWTGTDTANNPETQAWAYVMFGPGAWSNYYAPELDKESDESHVWPVKDWTWGPYTVVAHGWVDTGDWMGWLWVRNAPLIYAWDLQQWIMVDPVTRNATEGWVWIYK